MQHLTNRKMVRAILLAIPLLSFVIAIVGAIPSGEPPLLIVKLPQIVISNMQQIPNAKAVNWFTYILTIYLIGFVISIILPLINLIYYLRKPLRAGTAFSFNKVVYIPENTTLNKEMITLHEQAHVQQLHSLDVLYYHVIRAIFWINPIAYKLFEAIKQEHEFAADKYAIENIKDKLAYCELLVSETLQIKSISSLVHTFHSSNTLLNRLQMITQTQPQSVSGWKKIASIPLLALILILSTSSVQTFAQSGNEKVFKRAEIMPEYIGGQENMMKFLSTEIKYPVKCRDQKIEGSVVLKFVIDKNGRIKDIVNLKKDTDNLLVQEAMRVLKIMPNWEPGKNNGQPVNTEMVLPIQFQL